MGQEAASAVKQALPEAEFLFVEAENNARDTRGGPEAAGAQWGATVLKAFLWLVLIGGSCLLIWVCVGEARAAGVPPNRFFLLHELAGFLLPALILTRMARLWMEYGTIASRIQVRGRIIEITPKWNDGPVRVSTGQLGDIAVTEPAFGARPPRMTLIEKAGRRHTIRRLLDASNLDALAQYCRDAQIAYEQRRDSRVKEALFVTVIAVSVLAGRAAGHPLHPVRTILAIAGLVLVALVLARMHRKLW